MDTSTVLRVLLGQRPVLDGWGTWERAYASDLAGVEAPAGDRSVTTRRRTGRQGRGVVLQKDLGPKTAAIANAMKTFNPDSTWTRVEGGNG